MLLITGDDPVLTEQICEGLSHRGIAHLRVDGEHATAERGNLFQSALDARASGVVLIEPLAWRGAAPPPPPSDELLSAALSATHAPGVTSLLLVTSRRDDDDGLRRLRRDGVPYVVLRPAPLYRLLPSGVEASLEGRRVLVPADVAGSFKDAIPFASLVEEIARAVNGETPQGKIVEVAATPERSVLEVLGRAGAKPGLAGGLRSRLGRWFGQAVARVEGADLLIEGVAAADAEAPRRALEQAVPAAGP